MALDPGLSRLYRNTRPTESVMTCECESMGCECGVRVYVGEPGTGHWVCETVMKNTTTIKVWSRNNSGALIHAGEFESFDHAELAARVWNRSETRPGMRVDVIANTEVAAHATRVRAIV